jgi:hypothetical protein
MSAVLASYIAQFASQVAGIPCEIGVISYFRQKPLGPRADSDVDCYGYVEAEWQILDRRGRPAEWLAKKATERDEDRIEGEVCQHMERDE